MAQRRLSAETSVLAAARAALDPERASWQNDILISAIIEVLARKGPISQRELRDELGATWIGRRTSPALLAEALRRAATQELLIQSKGRRGKDTWSLPKGVREEAEQDREWARHIIGETEADIAARLVERFPERADLHSRARGLTKSLIDAMIDASRDVFQAVQQSTSPRELHDVRLNLRATMPRLRESITPPELADFVGELVLDAANPDERFANKIMGTIVAGQVLHGMVCRDDIPAPMPPTTLILDTSQLLPLASHDQKVRDLTNDFLAAASRAGCRLVLTDRVEDEWLGHWSYADELVASAEGRWGAENTEVLKLYNHRVLTEFALDVEVNEAQESFERWARERRRLAPVMAQYRIERVDTTKIDLDVEFLSLFETEIRSVQAGDGATKLRGVERCRTDAISASLVRAPRLLERASLVPAAWFVADDRSSERAYERLRGDDPFPLALKAATWLLHYAAFDQRGSSSERATLADRISEDLILEAFLGVAASYTAEEMLEIGDLIAEDDVLDRDDVRAALIDGFLHPEFAEADRARDFARARNVRRSDRVLRTEELHNEQQREAERRVRVAEAKAEVLESQLHTTDDARSEMQERIARARQAVPIMVLLMLALVVVALKQWISPGVVVLSVVIWLGLCAEAYRYVTEVATRRGLLLAGAASAILLGAAQVLAGAWKLPLH